MMKFYLLCAVDSQADLPGLQAVCKEDIVRIAGFLSLFVRPKPEQVWHDGSVSSRQACALVHRQWQMPEAQLVDTGFTPWLAQQDQVQECLYCGNARQCEVLLHQLCASMSFDVQHAHCWCFELLDDQTWRLCWSLTPALLRRL